MSFSSKALSSVVELLDNSSLQTHSLLPVASNLHTDFASQLPLMACPVTGR